MLNVKTLKALACLLWIFCVIGCHPGSQYRCQVTEGVPLPQERGGHVGGIVDDAIVIAAGSYWSSDKTTKQRLSDSEIYQNGIWKAGPALPHPLEYAMYAYDQNGLYVAGGTFDGQKNSSNVYRMTLLKPQPKWEILADLPLPISNGAGAILDHKFYVACGSFKEEKLNKMWVLDTQISGTHWKQCPSLPAAKRIYPALVTCGRHLYLLGGWTEKFTILNDAYRYDTQTDVWEKLPDLPMHSYCWTGRAIDDDHILMTGITDDKNPEIHDGIWILDVRDMSMERVGSTIVPSTTGVFVQMDEREWWLIGGEPDVNKNRTKIVSIIKLQKKSF